MFLKWLKIPASNDQKEIEVAQCWEVRWTSRHGGYSHDTRPQVEVFLSKEEAEAFYLSLTRAFALVKYTGSETYVEVRKAK